MGKRWILLVIVAPMVVVAALLMGLATRAPAAVQAAPVAPADVFLQGQYMEAGINDNGSFGSSTAAPLGYHPNDSGHPGRLGFVADYQKDGWTSGTPAYGGDFFLPGNPYEALVVEWTSGTVEHTLQNWVSSAQITPTTLTDTSSGGTHSAVWVGDGINGSESVRITVTYSFADTDLAINMDIQIQNTGGTALDSVEFARIVDPDNEQPWTGSYVTTNTVTSQPGVGGNPDLAVVQATGVTYPDMVLALTTRDARAKVSANVLGSDPDTILDSPVAGPVQSDSWIGLAYRFGTLAPGAVVTATAQYALALSALPSPDEADLAISKSIQLDHLTTVTYTIVARNQGPDAANDAVVSDTIANVISPTWTCVATGGAEPATASGTGDVQHTLTAFPASGVVTCTVRGTLADWGHLRNTAQVVVPAGVTDTDLSNNSATVERWQIFLSLVYKDYTP